MTIRLAFIFDLDGTLVDTETIHAEAESKLLNGFGIKITPEEITRKYAGIPTESYIEKIVNHNGSLDKLISKKNQIMHDIVREEGIHPINGMPELINYLSSLSIPIFVASSSDLEWIQKCLDAPFQINGKNYSYGHYFKLNFISCSEVKKPKPAPDVFWEGKKRMQKQYSFLNDVNVEWIVVGDSLADMEGALNAKMKAFIWGKFEDGLIKNNNATVFSTPEKLVAHIENIVKDVK